MALIVEDGTGSATAESYNSVAELDTYHTSHANATWTASTDTTAKEVAARRAGEYIDHRFGPRWKGRRVDSVQRMDWPRSGVTTRDDFYIDNALIPERLKHAHAEAALRAFDNDADLFIDEDEPGAIEREALRAGPVETDTTYIGGKSVIPIYEKIERFLSEYLESSSGVTRA